MRGYSALHYKVRMESDFILKIGFLTSRGSDAGIGAKDADAGAAGTGAGAAFAALVFDASSIFVSAPPLQEGLERGVANEEKLLLLKFMWAVKCYYLI